MNAHAYILIIQLDTGYGVVERQQPYVGYHPEDEADLIRQHGYRDANGIEAVTLWSRHRVISVTVRPA